MGFFYVMRAGSEAAGGGYLGVGKNKAIGGRVVGLSFGFMHFHDVQEVVQVSLFLFTADLLEGSELDYGFFELAGQALGVHAEIGQGFRAAF